MRKESPPIPVVCDGKPCIRGLRYPVEGILEWLAGGMSVEDILAAVGYAARVVHINRIISSAA